MRQVFAIGDIHGGLKALQELLAVMPLQKEDTIIFLGDYVDGWSEASGVIDFLMELESKQSCIFIKGNHDVWCLEWLQTGTVNELWFSSGGEATIKSYAGITKTKKKQHINFLERLRDYYVDDDNKLFIHAGFSSLRGPQHERYPANYTWDRTLWEMAIAMDKSLPVSSPFFPKRLQLFNEIYIGHTPTVKYKIDVPIQAYNVWNIDTGAAFKGKLSAINVQSKQFWQSKPVFSFYPNEHGRYI
ncbi:metallophosphoesterase [Ferruginibacter albus]|uniref:metallophosphoesterase n=1 Tax=Ferruginibacter albus TaxID=2875540 RepID=UPI001CC49D04|nr:metallophosphoesterase [Ferruginibacter albus]UAY51829.1 metallophosphoesterase [Ferruginibacter albus]